MERRAFIQGTALGAMGLAGLVGYKIKNAELVTGPEGLYFNIDYRPNGDSVKMNLLVVKDLKSGNLKEIPISIDPHSLCLSPANKRECFAIEKWDRSCSVIDIETQKEIIKFSHSALSYRQFIGHGIYSQDGKSIFCSEGIFNERGAKNGFAQGIITQRDSKTLNVIKEFSSFGVDPHELVWLNDGKTFAVCNQGNYLRPNSSHERNLSIIDSHTGKLISKFEIPYNLSPAHLLHFGDDNFLIVTRSLDFNRKDEQDQRLLLKMNNSEIELFRIPDSIKGKLSKELLSLAFNDESGIIATTYPEGKMVLFWDIHKKECIKILNTGRVTGVALSTNQSHFLINDLDNGTLIVDAKTLRTITISELSEFQMRHLDMPHSFITNHQEPG